MSHLPGMCKRDIIHPQDRELAKTACSVYDPSGVVAGVRWIPCDKAADYPEPAMAGFTKEWVLCADHYREAKDVQRKINAQHDATIREMTEDKGVTIIRKKGMPIDLRKTTVGIIDVEPEEICMIDTHIQATDPLFRTYKLNEDGVRKVNQIGLAFEALHDLLNNAINTETLRHAYGESNTEIEQMRLRLREAKMWATSAASMRPENRQ